MNKTDQCKLIYSGKYPLPLEVTTKKSYKILIFRSLVERGIISNIEIPDLPENYYIIRSEDLPGRKELTIHGEKIPLLAKDSVNYKGEPILIIVGPESKILKEIHKRIQVEYEIIEESNEIFFSKNIEIGEVKDLFKTSHKIVTGRMKTPNRIISKKLPTGAFTKKEADNFTVHTSSIWLKDLRDNISSICQIEADKIKIISPTVTGESEDTLIDNYYSSLYSTIASSLLKKNVYHLLSPEEQYQFTSNDYGLKGNWKIAFDSEDKLLATQVDVIIDCGAYPVFSEEKVCRVIHGITSMYKQRNILINVIAVKSNKPPVGYVSGLYLPEAQFFAEILINKIIKETKSDQLSWRELNILKKGNKNNTMSIIKNNLPIFDMLQMAAKESDFSRKNSSINLLLNRKKNRLNLTNKKGVGISIGYNGNSYISNSKNLMSHSLNLQLNRDNRVDLKVSCRITNMELISIWEDIISSNLDIESSNISIHTEDSSELLDSSPNLESKNINNLTPLLKQCCEEIKVRRFKDPLPISQTKVARRSSSLIWDINKWKGNPFKNSAYGSCVIEVEVDKNSLSIVIKEIWLILDVGKILHRSSIINSINREVMSVSKWLQHTEPNFESGVFSSSYRYNRDNSKIKPKINLTFIEEGKSKSVDSLIKSLLPGAYIQAVNQALGSNINSFPLSKEIVYKELIKDEN